MKCGYCGENMLWIGDNEDADERTYSQFECKKCFIELYKYWETWEEN